MNNNRHIRLLFQQMHYTIITYKHNEAQKFHKLLSFKPVHLIHQWLGHMSCFIFLLLFIYISFTNQSNETKWIVCDKLRRSQYSTPMNSYFVYLPSIRSMIVVFQIFCCCCSTSWIFCLLFTMIFMKCHSLHYRNIVRYLGLFFYYMILNLFFFFLHNHSVLLIRVRHEQIL